MAQPRKRSFFSVVLLGALAVGAAAAVMQPVAAHAVVDECANIKHARVKAWCGNGGMKNVKDQMKVFTDKAKAKAGSEVKNCKSCHKEQEKYESTGNATEDFDKHKELWPAPDAKKKD